MIPYEVSASNIFQEMHLPFLTWFIALWLHGLNAYGNGLRGHVLVAETSARLSLPLGLCCTAE